MFGTVDAKTMIISNQQRCKMFSHQQKKVASNTSGLFIEWGFFLKDVLQMFTFPPSYLNFLWNCEFPRNQDANQIKMILRHFLGANHKKKSNVKTLHLAILFGIVFLASNPIYPPDSPSLITHLQGTGQMYRHQHHLRRSCIWPCLHLR